jgi:hypothetical protein
MSTIDGDRPLGDNEMMAIKRCLAYEQDLLIFLNNLCDTYDIEKNPRWLAIARTHFEEGFMAIRRVIASLHPL